MANKVGLLLSLILFAQSLLFCGDLVGYQLAISKITSGSVYICRQVEVDKEVTTSLQQTVHDDLNATVSCVNSDCSVDEHGMLKIKITATYQPLLVWIWELGVPNITIYRTIFVGYGRG